MFNHTEFYYIVKPNDTLYKIAKTFQISLQDLINANPTIAPDVLTIGQVIIIPRSNYQVNVASNIRNIIRMLWEQHGAWTRMAITSLIFDTPEKDFVVNRLLRNPKDFAIVLEQFYGDEIAHQFELLLTNHLVLAADLVNASKAGKTEEASEIEKKWYQNADDIANLLSQINPYFQYEEWRDMLYEHLGFVKQEAVDILNKRYQDSIDTYDQMEFQILQMADMMANGIIAQFQLV